MAPAAELAETPRGDRRSVAERFPAGRTARGPVPLRRPRQTAASQKLTLEPRPRPFCRARPRGSPRGEAPAAGRGVHCRKGRPSDTPSVALSVSTCSRASFNRGRAAHTKSQGPYGSQERGAHCPTAWEAASAPAPPGGTGAALTTKGSSEPKSDPCVPPRSTSAAMSPKLPPAPVHTVSK